LPHLLKGKFILKIIIGNGLNQKLFEVGARGYFEVVCRNEEILCRLFELVF